MSIDLRVFGKSIEKAADMISAMLMNKYQEGREEEREVRRLERNKQAQMDIFKKQEDIRQAFEKDMSESQSKKQKEHEKWKIDYVSKVNNYLGSVDLMNFVNDAINSQDPNQKALASNAMTVIGNLKANKDITPEQEAMLSQLPMNLQGQIHGHVSELRRKNQEFAMTEEKHKAMLGLYQSQSSYMDAMRKGITTGGKLDLDGLLRIQQSASDSLAKLAKDPEFIALSQRVAESRTEGGKPLSPDEQLRWGIFNNTISLLQGNVGVVQAQLENFGIIKEMEQKEAQKVITEEVVKAEVGQPSLIETLDVAGQAIRKGVKVHPSLLGLSGWTAGRREKQIREQLGIPAGVKVYTEEDIPNLRKRGAKAKGAWVYFNGQVFRIGQRKKTWGLMSLKEYMNRYGK